jgi:hypothetical protein
MAKLPKDAFSFYVGLGDNRSFEKVGKHFGVTKRSVTKKARKERWTEQIEEMEALARKKARDEMQEGFDERMSRHWKMARGAMAVAAKGLRDNPITNGMDAIRAAEIAIKLERLLAGDPSEHSQQTIAEITKKEIHTLLTTRPASEDGPDDY